MRLGMRTMRGIWHISATERSAGPAARSGMLAVVVVCLFLSSMPFRLNAHTPSQDAASPQTTTKKAPAVLHYKIIHGDTVFVERLRPSRCWGRFPRQKGTQWRKYYRLVHNFSKTYPYALAAKKILINVDSTMLAEGMKRGKKDRYINQIQKELFRVFETPLRNMTVTQGALLMKLIDREIGKTSFKIIKDYKSGIAAGFWQGIAKLFGSDLKKPYDAYGEDKQTEDLVQLWNDGEFEILYRSIFGKDPPKANIPEKYR